MWLGIKGKRDMLIHPKLSRTEEREKRDFTIKDDTTDICIIVEGKQVHTSKWVSLFESNVIE